MKNTQTKHSLRNPPLMNNEKWKSNDKSGLPSPNLYQQPTPTVPTPTLALPTLRTDGTVGMIIMWKRKGCG